MDAVRILVWALAVQGWGFTSAQAADNPCSLALVYESVQQEALEQAQNPLLRQMPEPIKPLSSVSERGPGEIELTGTFIEKPGQLAHLKDEHYLYVIDSRGRPMITTRAPNLDVDLTVPNVQYYAGHRSLARKLLQQDPMVQIVAAGEIKIQNGLVREVNNKSGNFRGSRVNLDYALKKLKDAGLPVSERSEIIAVEERIVAENYAEKHLNDQRYAFNQIKYHNHPTYKRFEALLRSLVARFPHPKVAGTFDHAPIMTEVQKLIRSPMREEKREGLFIGSMIGGLEREGPAFTTRNVLENGSWNEGGMKRLEELRPVE